MFFSPFFSFLLCLPRSALCLFILPFPRVRVPRSSQCRRPFICPRCVRWRLCFNECSPAIRASFILDFICVFPGVLVPFQMVCAPCLASVCLNSLHREMKQASDLVGAVNQSHIKASAFQPIDDQGSGPESHRRRSQFSFPQKCECVHVCVRGEHKQS